MAGLDERTSSAILLATTTSISVFSGFLPSLAEVRKATKTDDPDVRNDVRMGEIAAVALVIGVGLTASAMVDSPAPGMASVICAVALVAMYESILSAHPQENPTK